MKGDAKYSLTVKDQTWLEKEREIRDGTVDFERTPVKEGWLKVFDLGPGKLKHGNQNPLTKRIICCGGRGGVSLRKSKLGRVISCSTFCHTHQEEVALALLLQHVDGGLGHLRQGRDVQGVLPFEVLVLEVIVGEQA